MCIYIYIYTNMYVISCALKARRRRHHVSRARPFVFYRALSSLRDRFRLRIRLHEWTEIKSLIKTTLADA